MGIENELFVRDVKIVLAIDLFLLVRAEDELLLGCRSIDVFFVWVIEIDLVFV